MRFTQTTSTRVSLPTHVSASLTSTHLRPTRGGGGADGSSSQSVNSMQIAFTSELDLPLYRHWTLYDSIRHSHYMFTHFRIWTTKGAKRLYEFLADMGLEVAVEVAIEVTFCDKASPRL